MLPALHDQTQTFENFSDFLASALHVGTKLRVYHVSTDPSPTDPLFAAPPGEQEEVTTCESHFLAVSQDCEEHEKAVTLDAVLSANGTNGQKDTNQHVLVAGIEVLIFTTRSLTNIFVSKADSTGFLSRPPYSTQGSQSIIRAVIATFLEWLVYRKLSSRTPETISVTSKDLASPDTENETGAGVETNVGSKENKRSEPERRLVLSLFARSQNQYLFPGSIDNSTKHVLDDRQLIRWWCRLLDGLVMKDWSTHSDVSASVVDAVSGPDQSGTSLSLHHQDSARIRTIPQAFVLVPGCDPSETSRSFFPPFAKRPQPGYIPRWHNSYPVDCLVNQSRLGSAMSLPVRCMIPRLPDDPKSRYCNDLDAAGTDGQGRWRDIRTIQQFWDTMEYRQECAAGRLVGFIWVIFEPVSVAKDSTNVRELVPEKPKLELLHGATDTNVKLSAPTTLQSDTPPLSEKYSPASVVLSAVQYSELADHLINQSDFAGSELAIRSTQEWVTKVKELSRAHDFGMDVDGQKTIPAQRPGSIDANDHVTAGDKHARDGGDLPLVNVLTGIRKKKRKIAAEPETHHNNFGQAHNDAELNPTVHKPATKEEKNDGAVMVLPTELVRKKV